MAKCMVSALARIISFVFGTASEEAFRFNIRGFLADPALVEGLRIRVILPAAFSNTFAASSHGTVHSSKLESRKGL